MIRQRSAHHQLVTRFTQALQEMLFIGTPLAPRRRVQSPWLQPRSGSTSGTSTLLHDLVRIHSPRHWIRSCSNYTNSREAPRTLPLHPHRPAHTDQPPHTLCPTPRRHHLRPRTVLPRTLPASSPHPTPTPPNQSPQPPYHGRGHAMCVRTLCVFICVSLYPQKLVSITRSIPVSRRDLVSQSTSYFETPRPPPPPAIVRVSLLVSYVTCLYARARMRRVRARGRRGPAPPSTPSPASQRRRDKQLPAQPGRVEIPLELGRHVGHQVGLRAKRDVLVACLAEVPRHVHVPDLPRQARR